MSSDALAAWSLLKQLRAQVAASEGIRDFQLDAAVEVPAEFYPRFLARGDGLREALVVSSLRVLTVASTNDGEPPTSPNAADSLTSPNARARVDLFPAAGEKCQRCWKYLPLGSDPEHPTLCAPCAQIVRNLEYGT